jgi:hypothetical protein
MGVLGVGTEHCYQTCRDDSCERFACRVYREGYAAGYGAGHAAGHAEGQAAGYDQGHADGCVAGEASASKGG